VNPSIHSKVIQDLVRDFTPVYRTSLYREILKEATFLCIWC